MAGHLQDKITVKSKVLPLDGRNFWHGRATDCQASTQSGTSFRSMTSPIEKVARCLYSLALSAGMLQQLILPLKAEPAELTQADKEVAGDFSSPFSIPFDGAPKGSVEIQVSINGEGPFNFLLDTGAERTVVYEEIAQKLRLPLSESGIKPLIVNGAGKNIVQIRRKAQVKKLEIGKASLKNVDLYILPVSSHSFSSTLSRIDGILGNDLLQRSVFQIDYESQKITFFQSRDCTQAVDPVGMPIFFLDKRKPSISAEIDGIPAQLEIDTGSFLSLELYPFFVETQNLLARYPRKIEQKVEGVNGIEIEQMVRAQKLKFGNIEVSKPLIYLATQGKKDTSSRSISGNIGNAVLSRFSVTFDYQRQRMSFVKNNSFDKPFNYVDLQLKFQLPKGVVTYAPLESPAGQAGIRVGDKITAIDGVPLGELGPKELYQKSRKPPGETLLITIERKNIQKDIQILLENAL